jgi:peptidoglycan/xylan/chitin deacetylase (PgdA/CDA1 family)
MHPLKKYLARILLWTGINAIAGGCMHKQIFLIGYHNIRGARMPNRFPKVTIDAAVLEKHLAYLKRNGHTFVSTDYLRDPKNDVHKPTIVYFDDGFRSVLSEAEPLLRKYGAQPVVFVTTGIPDASPDVHAGEGWTSAAELMQEYLSWDELRELQARGAVIGAHGRTHRRLTQCSPKELERELLEPRERIAKELGREPDIIAYPHGRVNGNVADAVARAGYRFGISSLEGTNTRAFLVRKPYLLRKIAPKPYDDLAMFKAKVYSWNGIVRFEEMLRSMVSIGIS